VGAVTGKVIVQSSGSFSTNVEKTYRGIFDILRQGESNLDSTPIFNGPLSAYRRELIDEIREDTVTDDIELAMNIRKKGFRTLYDDRAIFYERYPSTLRGRLKQKQRRAQGLVQSLLRHSSMIFRRSYGKYGSIILPSHFFMSIVSPILVLVLLLSFAISVFFMPGIFLVSALVLLLAAEGVSRLLSRMTGKKRLTPIGFIETFLDGQFSLLLGMLTLMYRTDYAWEKIEEIRQEPNLSTPIS
jgi:cellulose synthase/poly-beta-1,6-N-acetylglucosamine synthase-like glycosyltransferase